MKQKALKEFDDGVLTHSQGKRLFIKDIIHYLVPPNGAPASTAPSLERKKRGVGTPKTDDGDIHINPSLNHSSPNSENPTVLPKSTLNRFHFTFLIRHPCYSIPSYYRCTVPPLNEITGFNTFMPSEAGYDELRRVFDYLRGAGQIGPHVATHGKPESQTNGREKANAHAGEVDICVIDADDLLDHPAMIVKAFCKSVGIDYDERMLNWNSKQDHEEARAAFEKWKGFHEEAMNSCDLKPRMHVSYVS